jgi:hypothetical protein
MRPRLAWKIRGGKKKKKKPELGDSWLLPGIKENEKSQVDFNVGVVE